jgi:hypothetical protein
MRIPWRRRGYHDPVQGVIAASEMIMQKIARLGSAILLLSVASSLAQAQDATQLCPCSGPAASGVGRQKALQCRTLFQGQGMRGDDLLNYAAVCVEEARLACLKQAAAQKVRIRARQQFMGQCMGA